MSTRINHELCIIIGNVQQFIGHCLIPLDHGFVWVVLIFLFARIFILMKIFKVVLCFVLKSNNKTNRKGLSIKLLRYESKKTLFLLPEDSVQTFNFKYQRIVSGILTQQSHYKRVESNLLAVEKGP